MHKEKRQEESMDKLTFTTHINNHQKINTLPDISLRFPLNCSQPLLSSLNRAMNKLESGILKDVFLISSHLISFAGHSCISLGSDGKTNAELHGMFLVTMPSRGIIVSQNNEGKRSKEQLLFNNCLTDFSFVMKGHCHHDSVLISLLWTRDPPSMSTLS